MTDRPCMGGFCAMREECRSYRLARTRLKPTERLCLPGSDGIPDPMKTSTLADRLTHFFRVNPDETLTSADAAIKFDCTRQAAQRAMRTLCDVGELEADPCTRGTPGRKPDLWRKANRVGTFPEART